MRLGAYPAALRAGSKVSEVYGGAPEIFERHRHRYEVNTATRTTSSSTACASPACRPTACCRRSSNTRTIRVHRRAYHPEPKSWPFEPQPLFASFVKAAAAQSRLA